MNTLRLTLQKQWFDMILSGEKKEEYREIKPFWFERLVFQHKKVYRYLTGFDYADDMHREDGVQHISEMQPSRIGFKPFEYVEFRNGYGSNMPTITVECKGIEIRRGKTEWGAHEWKMHYVIKLGEIISKSNIKED